jgi:hypothetical protein
MKKIISVLLIYTFSLQLSAQQFKVALTEQQEESHILDIYALPGGGFIAMKYKQDIRPAQSWTKRRQTISILRYDASMKLVKENKLANGEKSFGVVYTALKKSGDTYWLIYTEPGTGNEIGDFKAAEVNPLTLETGPSKTIAASAETSFKPVYALLDERIEFKSSPNGMHHSLFMITDKKVAFLCSLDEQLNSLWNTKAVAKDIDCNPADVSSVEVDNQGNIYLGYVKVEAGYVAVYKNTKTPQVLDVKLDNGKPKDVLLLAHKNNSSITIAGGYFEKGENIRGVYKANIDASYKINNITISPFGDDIVKQFDNDSWGSTKPNKYGIEPKYIAQLFEVDDKIVDMVIEIKQKVYHEKIGTVVHSGNLLNVYFNNETASFTRMPKYNVAAGSGWAHFYAMPFEKKMIIFYNDNPVNLTRDINASPKLVNIEDNSVLVAAVIEPDGSMQRRLPLEIKQNYMGIAEWMKAVTTNSLQVPVYFKKKLSYATISIQ